MLIYIGMTALAILFAFFSTKTENRVKKTIFFILTLLPFIIVSSIRYDVGTDFSFRYSTDFYKVADGIKIENLEPGFILLIKFCLIFSRNSQILFFVTSALITFFVISEIFKNSKNICYSILLFFIGTFFFLSLNMVRQFLAMSIILFCYRFLFEKKKYVFFLMGVIIAFTIHSSSIIMVILLSLKKKLFAQPIFLAIAVILILILETNIMSILSPIIENTRFDVYLIGKYAKGDPSYLGILVNTFLYAYMYIIYRIKKKRGEENLKEDIFLLNIQGIALLTMSMTAVHILFARISSYFSIFQIISIPYFTETLKIQYKQLKAESVRIILYIIIFLCFGASFIHTNIRNNNNEPLPYKTIFNKEG